MITIGGAKVEFTNEHPTEEGKYLWKCRFTGAIEVVTLRRIPASNNHGIQFESYLGIAEQRDRNVIQLIGKFAKIEEHD